MPRGVGGEAMMQANSFGDPSYHLVPRVSATPLCRVAIRLGAEEPASTNIFIGPFIHVNLEKLSGDITVHHDASSPVLRCLRSNGNLLQRKSDIPHLKGNQFTSSESSIVGQE